MARARIPNNAVKLAILAALVAGALVIGLLSRTPSAVAAGEVFVDPGSPSGKEYAQPVPRARREASGRAGAPAGGDANAPIFGVGVSPGGGASGGGASGTGTDKRSRVLGASSQAAALDPSNGGGLISGTSLALAIAVLALGAGLGVVVRRIQRPAS